MCFQELQSRPNVAWIYFFRGGEVIIIFHALVSDSDPVLDPYLLNISGSLQGVMLKNTPTSQQD